MHGEIVHTGSSPQRSGQTRPQIELAQQDPKLIASCQPLASSY